jgi:hypothetical protein
MTFASDDLRAFLAESRGQPGWGVKLRDVLAEKLPSRIWVDASVLTGDIAISALLAGNVSDTDLPQELLEAYRIAYPREHAEQSLGEFLQSHAGDHDALQAVASTLKGKCYELSYVEYLNDERLPQGQHAELADSPTQPGYDIEIFGANGEVVDRINTKATAAGSYVREHLDRYPGIDAVTTIEAAADLRNGEVTPYGSIQDLDEPMSQVVDTQSNAMGALIAVPWLAIGLLSVEAWRQAYVHHERPAVVLRKTAKRGLWLGVGTGITKWGTAVFGTGGGIVSVLVYTGMRQRWSSAEGLHTAIDGYGRHLRNVNAGLRGQDPEAGTAAT